MGPKSLTNDVSCPRSCSIDSLRTPGHSRSVSHDSYFDILQSPLRGITACPSRELSELVLNFDREEPEMRIFSESESLVSSPKVAKDTVPRRILRARPEEYSSGANSINPSPKKQPRLNLSSPNELKTWATIISEVANESSIKEKVDDESTSCKRYKFEDQLSDIQFIDCNTPEHSVTTVSGNTGYTIYTSIQIHSPPSMYDNKEQHKTIIDTNNSVLLRSDSERYSYPATQYTTFAATKKEERFSYPIAITTTSSPKHEKEIIKGSSENVYQMNISESPPVSNKKSNTIDTSSSPSKMVVHDVQRSNSEVFNKKNEMNRSKLSVTTPQSPVKSPCYSLLIGSTASSASSSPVNTPINYDMDICNLYEPISFTNTKENNENVVSVMQTFEDKRDSKKDLSLNLMRNSSKINVTSSPATPQILTANSDKTETADTTSQSITPSEIHYENLSFNRQSLTPEISPRVDDIHHNNFVVKPTIVHVPSPSSSNGKTSPIKSTINITYNLKSPSSVKSDESEQKFFADDFNRKTDYEIVSKEGLLETAFDDSMVYEQVKFFRHAVEEVNELVDDKTSSILSSVNERNQEVPNVERNDEAEAEDHYEIVFKDEKMLQSDIHMKESSQNKNQQEEKLKDHEIDAEDSLEYDQNVSLYENVEVKKPPKIYENVPIPPPIPPSPVKQIKVNQIEKLQDSADKEVQNISTENKSPTNFSNVKKLATRFETSPVEVQPAFDFHRSPSHRSRAEVQLRKNNRNAELYTITRSLDENAFIREFGSARKFEEFNKSINEIADLSSLSSNSSGRRKSTEYSKPKVLNQPKKIPGFGNNISEVHENCKKSIDYADGNGHKLKLNIGDSGELIESQKSPANERQPLQTFNVRITPTSENRISLIQNNFEGGLEKKTLADEEKSTSTTSLTSLKMLKLDRERIEKIKEERRHQLSEKYRSESFRNLNNNVKLSKPKSKQEINIDDFDDELCTTHKFKSKSRNELDYEQPISLINTTTASSSTQNLITTSNNRIRRISDEKNQNDIDSGIDDQVVLRCNDATSSESRDSIKYDSRNKAKPEKKSFDFTRERNNPGNYRYSQNSNQ